MTGDKNERDSFHCTQNITTKEINTACDNCLKDFVLIVVRKTVVLHAELYENRNTVLPETDRERKRWSEGSECS